MEDYPKSYVAKSFPVIVISGLQVDEYTAGKPNPQQNGLKIASDSPLVGGELARRLTQSFQSFHVVPDFSLQAAQTRSKALRFNVGFTGRQFSFTRRKASPAPSVVSYPPRNSAQGPNHSPQLHSPLSPLSPGSPLHPDGLMTPLYTERTQELVPALIVSFFGLSSDPGNESLADNRLKAEINAIKSQLGDSSFRTRFAVAIVGQGPAMQQAELEERLNNIRKGAKLDSKTAFFYIPQNSSPVETNEFVRSLLIAVYPLCIDFYRDLTKHARRKRDKGQSPVQSPESEHPPQVLLRAGWLARYNFKLGLFAEIRQEMITAGEQYDMVLENMFNPTGPLENVSSWSPRWNEFRLFADAVAVRRIRCLLETSNYTGAVAFWQAFRDKMQSLVDAKGKGSACYGWKAWEARWAKIMAQLIEDTDVLPASRNKLGPVFLSSNSDPGSREPSIPWRHLHHSGYWWALSARETIARRALAEAIPEEDLNPPDQSPATHVARRSETYDTFLVPEPHVEGRYKYGETTAHSLLIFEALDEAISQFAEHGQPRIAEHYKFILSLEYERSGLAENALTNLKSLCEANHWRNCGWWSLLKTASLRLNQLAVKAEDVKTQDSISWEMSNNVFGQASDLLKSQSVGDDSARQVLSVETGEVRPPVHAAFCFRKPSCQIGEVLQAQLVLRNDSAMASGMKLEAVEVFLEGLLHSIKIVHSADSNTKPTVTTPQVSFSEVVLKDASGTDNDHFFSVKAVSDLSLLPGQMHVFQFQIPTTKAGNLTALRTRIIVSLPGCDLHYSEALTHSRWQSFFWWVGGQGGIYHERLLHDTTRSEVHAKKPNIGIAVRDLRSAYRISELASLTASILNKEKEAINATLELRLIAERKPSPRPEDELSEPEVLTVMSGPIRKVLGEISASEHFNAEFSLRVPSDPQKLALEVRLRYHLVSEPSVEVSRTVSASISVLETTEPGIDGLAPPEQPLEASTGSL